MKQRYEIRKRIGQGGLGAVFNAYDHSLHREVAIKRVLPETEEDQSQLQQKLIQEAKTLSALQHPNIVTVYDVGQDDEGPFLVMELLKGETLDKTIERGALPLEDFRSVVTQVLEAMIAANHAGLVHRDLKPANIMIKWLPSGKFQLKILDFGLAKFSAKPSLQTIDQSDSILGSIYFMAPEQFERAPLDVRTDLYSVGGILYYSLTGVYPFQGETGPQVMASHLQGRFTPLDKLRPDLPAWVCSWVTWLMSRDVADRPANPTVALNAFMNSEGRPVGATPVTAKPDREATPASAPPPVATAAPAPQAVAAPGSPPMLKPAAATKSPAAPPLVRAAGATSAASATPLAKPAGPSPTAKPSSEAEIVAEIVPEDELEADLDDDVEITPGVFARFPKWALITIPLLILAVGGYLMKVVLDTKKTKERQERFSLLVNEGVTEPAIEDVRLLYSFMAGENEDTSRVAANTLSKMKPSDEADQFLISQIPEITGEVQTTNLLKVLGLRNATAAFPAFLNLAESGATPKIRQTAWGGLGQITSATDLPSLLGKLNSINPGEQSSFVNATINICERLPSGPIRTRAVLDAYKLQSDPKLKRVLLTILSRLGGEDAFQELIRALDSADPMVRNGAVAAMAEWPTGRPMSRLIEMFKAEAGKKESIPIRKVLSNALAELAGRPTSTPQSENSKVLAELAEMAWANEDDKKSGTFMTLVQAVMLCVAPESKTYLESLRSRPELGGAPDAMIAEWQKAFNSVVPLDEKGDLPISKVTMLGQGAEIKDGVLYNWYYADNPATWVFEVKEAGTYKLFLKQACLAEDPGRLYIYVGDEPFMATARDTGARDQYQEFEFAEFKLNAPGIYRLWLIPGDMGSSSELMVLAGVSIRK